MWVCLRCRKTLIIKGAPHHYAPGEWVKVGRHIAREWLAGGEAYDFAGDGSGAVADKTTGIVLLSAPPDGWMDRCRSALSIEVASIDAPCVPFAETLLYTPGFDLRLDLVLIGLGLLKRWQVAVPLWDYTTLAAHVGSEDERARTKAIIRDLRVPLRDTRLVFLRRCAQTRELVECWNEETADSTEPRLAFLRAMYRIKPVVCDLPASWTGNVR